MANENARARCRRLQLLAGGLEGYARRIRVATDGCASGASHPLRFSEIAKAEGYLKRLRAALRKRKG